MAVGAVNECCEWKLPVGVLRGAERTRFLQTGITLTAVPVTDCETLNLWRRTLPVLWSASL